MSEHNPKIIERKSLSDTIESIRISCCDDPNTETWHTITDLHLRTEEQLIEFIENAKVHVSMRHEKSSIMRKVLDDAIAKDNQNTTPKVP